MYQLYATNARILHELGIQIRKERRLGNEASWLNAQSDFSIFFQQ
jgi:hypothetical protein